MVVYHYCSYLNSLVFGLAGSMSADVHSKL